MRSLQKAATLAVVSVAAASLGGCALAPKVLSYFHLRRGQPVMAIRPASTAVEEAALPSPEDRLYDQAKRAIAQRDYASALEFLQLAKQQTPNDGRVLNALGVVYDKLGRFDLSSRYYRQALAAEPNSAAVLANMQYSQKLQELRGEQSFQAAADAPAITSAELAKVQALRAPPVLLGASVRIINASGDPAAAQRVRQRLSRVGWSVRALPGGRRAQDGTVIVFSPAHQRVAEALARTLPFHSSLERCADACPGIELVVGANARARGRS